MSAGWNRQGGAVSLAFLSDGSIGSPVGVHGRPISAPLLGRLAGWTFPVVFVLLFILVAFVPSVTSGTAARGARVWGPDGRAARA